MSRPTLLLSRAEVESLVDLTTATEWMVDLVREQAAGRVVPRAPMHVNVPAGALRVVSGAVLGAGVMGLRATGAQALARASGAAMLFDVETADLLCVMAYPFGTLRTSAMFAVATDYLAPREASRLAMVGTGRNALGLVRAALAVRPVESVTVYGRNEANLAAFQAEIAEKIGVTANIAKLSDGLGDADLVFVSTDSPTPVLTAADVPPGAFVAGMGSPTEFDSSIYLAADRVVVTSVVQEKGFRDSQRHESKRSTLAELDESGELPWSALVELGDVVAGTAPDQSSGATSIFRESAGGYGDIALAARVYERARQLHLGSEMSFD